VAKPHSSPPQDVLRQEFFTTGDASRVLAGKTRLVDGIVLRAYEEFLAPAFPGGMTILAVGGFGRRELFPYSDVDLLLLVGGEPRRQTERDALSAFVRTLWDSGLRVSHSVRTPSECCELHAQNIELNISILDQRFLMGDPELYEELGSRLPRFVYGQRQNLARHLCRLTRSRHAKHGHTIYHLEPNIKEGPGGLRDFQLIHWLGQLRSAQPDRMPDPEPFPELHAARDFLWSLRCYLQYKAGRDHNLLTFDAQEEITEQPFLEPRDPAVWMRDYFRHARGVHRAAIRWMENSESAGSVLFAQFRGWRSRLSNADFTVSRERVYFRAPHQLEQDPKLVLRLFEFVARHGLRPAFESEKRLQDHLPLVAEFFSGRPPLWGALDELLSLPHAALALQCMHETGVLGALFPEWAGIECLVIRDFYHRYTVDEHTLVSIRNLTELPNSEEPLRRRFAQLFQEVERPGFLLFALLFHDTGKASRTGAHVAESARLAEGAMERIQMPDKLRQTVKFLIERHLDLSTIMNSRDLDDPSTAQFVADRARTLERLKELTLLTYADVSAVNPTAMTPWRLEQLWRLYLIAYNKLTQELDTARIEAPAAGTPEKAAFLDGFPTRYLRTHSEAEVEGHFQLQQRSREHGVAVDIRRGNGVYCLTLVTGDRPFLLASITGALAGFGMNILKAEAFGNRHGIVLDTFIFSDPNRTLELNPTEMDRFRLTIERVVLGKLDVKHLLENRPKPLPPSRRSRIQPNVAFDAEASPSTTLIEVVAEDRPGLLHDLTRTISSAGCNIEVVLIDTEAHKALDVFYVTADGQKLNPAHQASLRESLLLACQI
jgi:[protein-PII] uridylyltransferase